MGNRAFVKGHNHGVATRFKKGQSGNPGGRPKALVEVEALARTHTPAAIEGLVRVLKDPASPAAAVVSAANALLDRAWGKPLAQVQHSGTISSLGAALDAAFARIESEDQPVEPDPDTKH